MKDNIFDQPINVAPFVFDEMVAQVFPDMIKRSVPGYANVVAGTGLIAGDYIQPASNCYDLGCSVGASTFAMLQHIKINDFRLVAVDNSSHMVRLCWQNIHRSSYTDKVEVACADIQNTKIHNAFVVVLNFTLQFIPLGQRTDLLSRIFSGMVKDGVLVLSEKLAFETKAEQQRQTALHESFKRVQGYSELEISQKRAVLENVLVPESLETHLQRLIRIGFKDAQMLFRSINFASIMAWK